MKITPQGSAVIYGRSDSTLNRMGVRMGTSEIYRAVEQLDEIETSLVVDLPQEDGTSYMPLFVVLRDGKQLSADLERTIRARIRADLSPRHVPDAIVAVAAVPTTPTGKKLEVPVKRILSGVPLEEAVGAGAGVDPEALAVFAALAGQFPPR